MKTTAVSFYLLFVMLSPLSASVKIIMPSEDVPLELQIILGELELSEEDEATQKVQEQIAIIDQSFKEMSEQDILFFVKSQVYKSIIATPPKDFEEELGIDMQLIREFDKMVTKNEDHSSLQKWLTNAILSDLERLKRNTQLQRALIQMEQGRPLSDQEQREFNKVKLILPWMRALHYAGPEQVNEALKRLALNTIERLSLTTFQYLKFGRFEGFAPSVSPTELTFFEIIDHEKKKQKMEKDRIQKIVERIIANPKELPRPVDDWVPSDDSGASAQRSQQIRPDPNYQPPDSLPKPVDDWIEDL